MIINHELIESTLLKAKNADKAEIEKAVIKAESSEKLDYYDIALLLQIEDKDLLARIFKLAGQIKQKIYGNRVVIFAPLYVSNYCVNNCTYCGFP